MKPLFRPLVLPLAFSLAAPAVPALQVSQGGSPPSLVHALPGDLETVTLPAVDEEGLLLEDSLAAKNAPLRFGETLSVDFGLGNAGRWEELADGGRVWRLAVASEGARSLSFLFDRWLLPDGGEFFVRNADASMVLGAFTSANNRLHGQFATQPVVGDVVFLEYYEPAWVNGLPEIHVEAVVHAYRDVYGEQKGGDGADGSGSCNINVACALGDEWQDEKRSVAKLIMGGFLCSGALINNTAQDQKQFFLTANHCIIGNPSTWTFIFNNEAATCGGNSGPSSDSVVGSIIRANSSASDFGLVEITELIPQSYGVYYAGWDNSGANPTEGTGIHHPSGDIKKICFDDDVITEDSGGTWLWHVANWEEGVTEGGSSGSPLFDQNHRIVGQLCCGAAFCGFVFDDFYGQFDRSWGFGASSVLDPLGTGQQTLDGLDAAVPPAPPTLTSTTPADIPALFAFKDDDVVTLHGTSLLGTTDLIVDGTPLTLPGAFSVLDASTIEFHMPIKNALGPIDLTVITSVGQATLSVDIVPASPPVLRLGEGATPEQLFSFVEPEFRAAGQPGNLIFLYGSTDLLPTTVPGVLDLAIGNDFTTLVYVDAVAVPAQGWGLTTFFIPPGILTGGTTVWCQGFEYDPISGQIPVEVTNVSEGWFLF